MAILELQRINELNDFEIEWNQLLSNSLDNNPFLTYEWLTLWWKHFGTGKELKLYLRKRRGSLACGSSNVFDMQSLGFKTYKGRVCRFRGF